MAFSVKIIGYVGSPHKNGNTAFVVKQILKNAKNAETEIYYSSELEVSPCKGCLWCVDKDKCVINDDMQKIYTSMKKADVLVIGTPIYMGQMTGRTKVFTDRLYPQISPCFSPYYNPENAGKKLVLVFTQGNPDITKFQTYIDYTKAMFEMLEFNVIDVITVGGTRTTPASEQKEVSEKLKQTKNLLEVH